MSGFVGQSYSGTLWPGRSISIDPLALHNIAISDLFVICHDSMKPDKEGEKIHNKAVYCNPPLDPIMGPGDSL